VPYPSEHACRLRDPKTLDIVGSDERKSDGKTYRIIFGKPKDGDGGAVEQAYRYPKETWTEAEAKHHCEEHDGIMFEPASEPRQDQLQYHLDIALFQTNGIIEKDGVLSVPTVFTKEGVQNGAFKSKEQLRDSYRWLTNRPVVIMHPEGWPLHHQKPSGFTSEPSFREEDGAVVGFTNFWVDRTPKCVLEGVKAGRIREGSVGYWCNNIPKTGSWKEQPYTYVEESIVFEHYAILPGNRGACPCSQGCGLMNSQSQPQDVTSLNQAQASEKGVTIASQDGLDPEKVLEKSRRLLSSR
jgi:hypothetical protein